MKKHTKVYMDHFNYSKGDYIQSEITGLPANDIHHIVPRRMGGNDAADHITNLMAVTRSEHLIIENNPHLDWYFYFIHLQYLAHHVAWAQNPLSKNDHILHDILMGGKIQIDRSNN